MPQDFAEAVRWYRLAADQGHAAAQFSLGLRHSNGQGVLQDDRQAAAWYRLAADQGLAEAQAVLGQLSGTGRGVPQDDAEAARWYRHVSVAIEKRIGGHLFQVNVSNGLGGSPAQVT